MVPYSHLREIILPQVPASVKLIDGRGPEEGREVHPDDSAQRRSGEIACHLDETLAYEGDVDEEVDDERDQNDEGCSNQAFQKPVFLGCVSGGDAEEEKDNHARDERDSIEGGGVAGGFSEVDEQCINAGEDGKNKDEAKVNEEFPFDFRFQCDHLLNYIFELSRLEPEDSWIG
jgi:hypothetical protein